MNNCIVCKNEDFIKIYNGTLLKCSKCGFITANDNHSEDDLKKIYSENYFLGEEYIDYLGDKKSIQKNFIKRINSIKRIKKLEIKSVLEIGCAYGFFGELWTIFFPYSEYKGIDIAATGIKYGKETLNLNLIEIDYLNFSCEKKYDAIFMWDVIEHLKFPEKFVEKSSNELNNKGLLFISTGNISALLSKIQKEKWRMIHPPSHLHYFSPNSITLLLKNYGFEVESIKYPSIYRSLKQTFFSLFILNNSPSKLFKKIYSKIPNDFFFPINTYDIMLITARKK